MYLLYTVILQEIFRCRNGNRKTNDVIFHIESFYHNFKVMFFNESDIRLINRMFYHVHPVKAPIKTDKVSGMKESYNEDLANHIGPESCAFAGNSLGEALTGVRAGRVLSPEIT